MSDSLSLVIVTYQREQVLLDTVASLLTQARDCEASSELLIVDQTEQHDSETIEQLAHWQDTQAVRIIRLERPDLVGAMNTGLESAKGDIVLYTDDDVRPQPGLLDAHLAAHRSHTDAVAVVGQILQPGEEAIEVEYRPSGSHMRRYMDFPFNSSSGCYIENAMAGNLSLKKQTVLDWDRFDPAFGPPVASRFESDFAKRLVRAGHKIWFEPAAGIHHLQAASGGTRSQGLHQGSPSPVFSVGDYYFAFKHGTGLDRLSYFAVRFIRQVCTRYHLRRPWKIPVKWLGEIRGFLQAYKLYRSYKAMENKS